MAQQIVIDANATLALFLRLPYSEKVELQMRAWQSQGARLVVPILWEYECLSAFRRAVTIKPISAKDAEQMVEDLIGLEFLRVAPTIELHRTALRWAARIGQSKVYDAQYLAVAESLSAEFWTADQRLGHILQELGVAWVHPFV